MATYIPPRHPLAVLQALGSLDAIESDSPQFVDTDAARGGVGTQNRLARKFGLDLASQDFFPTSSRHVLLFGPIGSGKSTELRRLAKRLEESKKLVPVMLNVRSEVDINNLQYADILMALASAVLTKATTLGLTIEPARIQALKDWFKQQIADEDTVKELIADLTAGADVEVGVPFFTKLFSKFSSTMRTSSTYKESVREVVKKSFTQFASAFNELVLEVETQLRTNGKGERLLLIVDGTDKIPLDDAQRLFVYESEQLLAIDALVLYTAPISLKFSIAGISRLATDDALPIIKLTTMDGERFDAGWTAMREMLARRIDLSVFADDALIEKLIASSGGHPRELLQLLTQVCLVCETATITDADVEKALDRWASQYRDWLSPDDYTLLARIDAAKSNHDGNDEQIKILLWRLALLQYNDGSWRATHPIVKRLEGYRVALAKVKSESN